MKIYAEMLNLDLCRTKTNSSPTLLAKILHNLAHQLLTQRPRLRQRARDLPCLLRVPLQHPPRLVRVILARKELHQLDRRVNRGVRVRLSQPRHPSPLLQHLELEARGAQIRQQIPCPMERMRADDVEDLFCLYGGLVREGDVDDGTRDCVDREPERGLVEGRESADGLCALQHEGDGFGGVPDAVGLVADDLADAEDARADAGLLRGVGADVFADELGLCVAHVLGEGEALWEGFGDVWAGCVEDGAGGGAEVEGCGGGALGFEAEVDEVLDAGDAVFFEAA